MQTLKRFVYHPEIDFIRIICIVSVILIHTTTKVLAISKNNLVACPFALFLNQLTRFAVPIFFMISAFGLSLSYSRDLNYFSYLKQRLSKILIPYLFWSFLYYYFIYPHSSRSMFQTLLHGSASYQLYFIPALFLFYLFFPLIFRISKFLNHPVLLSLLFIIQLIFLGLDYYYRPLSFAYPINVFLLNFLFFILGILASQHQERILNFVKKYKNIFISLSFLLAIYITLEGAIRYYKTRNYLSFYSQWRPSVLLDSLVVFGLLFYLGRQTKIKSQLIKKISSYSFFVYFIHIIFIEIISKHFSNTIFNYPLISFLLVLIPSYLVAYLSSKIPKLSLLTG